MDAVAAANHRRELMLLSPGGDNLRSTLTSSTSTPAACTICTAKAVSPHRCSSGRSAATGWRGTNVLGDIRREGDDIVVERALELFAPLEAERGASL